MKPLLADVLASVAVIDVAIAPRGLDIEVGEVVIHDAIAPPQVTGDAVVLAVGIDATAIDAMDVVRRGGAAVVLKAPADLPDVLTKEAERTGVALLWIPAEMTWSQAHSLLRTAVMQPSDDATTSGVPLGDLFALANAVAAMVGGPTTIEDRQSRVLAYSTLEGGIDEPRRQTILGRQVPAEWLQRLEDAGVFRRLWAGELVRYDAEAGLELSPRIAIAVRAGDTILGSLWVAEGDVPLGTGAEDALREAARIAALHLIRHRTSVDIERNVRGELFASILDGRASIDASAFKLGVKASAPFVVLAFEPVSTDEVTDAVQRERALDLVALYGEAFRQRTAITQVGRTIYVLLPGPTEKPARLLELCNDIVGRAKDSLSIRMRGAVGTVVSHLRDVARSRDEADRVLRALAGTTAGDVADVIGAHRLIVLNELRDLFSQQPHLRSRALQVLVEHDTEHGTSYVDTLRAYLDAFGDISVAAKFGGVHTNTFRYRLKRLGQIADLNLHDPTDRLLVELDLRMQT